ncbi:MAG: amino acid ABC transporter permease [Acidimicrobiia bacterium]|nr:MAG: amino acid ABC transporter permease [Acidimicrobiia bacterium]
MAATVERLAPPDRGWRYHLRHQTPWSRLVLAASIAVLAFFLIGSIAVLTAHGWTQTCPPDATRLECSPSDPLAEGLKSAGLGMVSRITVVAGLLVAVIGFAAHRRMPTRSAREAMIAAGVLSIQAVFLAGGLLWFRGTDVDRFARNFLNFALIGQKAGLAWDTVIAEWGSIIGLSALWAAILGGLTAAYSAWKRLGRRPVVIAAVTGATGGALWGLMRLAHVPSFIKGAQNTLVLSAAGAALGFGLGLVLALFTMSKRSVVRAPARIYINFFRGTPLIWQISFAGIGLVPALRLDLSMYSIAILVLGLNLAAYSAEVYRAGIQSLERGQIEAARTLGLTYAQSMRYVVVPQAIRRVIPPLLNEFVILIKDTSLVSVLGLTVAQKELLGIGRDIYSSTFDATAWLGAAAGYLIITLPMIRIVTTVERRLRSGLTSVIG